MVQAKKGLSDEQILNREELRVCNFSIDTIEEYTKQQLQELGKEWNPMQIDILVQGVENSDWLKIKFETEELVQEICEWIERLEEEWKESGEFGYELK